jgi:hypothetical protein
MIYRRKASYDHSRYSRVCFTLMIYCNRILTFFILKLLALTNTYSLIKKDQGWETSSQHSNEHDLNTVLNISAAKLFDSLKKNSHRHISHRSKALTFLIKCNMVRRDWTYILDYIDVWDIFFLWKLQLIYVLLHDRSQLFAKVTSLMLHECNRQDIWSRLRVHL